MRPNKDAWLSQTTKRAPAHAKIAFRRWARLGDAGRGGRRNAPPRARRMARVGGRSPGSRRKSWVAVRATVAADESIAMGFHLSGGARRRFRHEIRAHDASSASTLSPQWQFGQVPFSCCIPAAIRPAHVFASARIGRQQLTAEGGAAASASEFYRHELGAAWASGPPGSSCWAAHTIFHHYLVRAVPRNTAAPEHVSVSRRAMCRVRDALVLRGLKVVHIIMSLRLDEAREGSSDRSSYICTTGLRCTCQVEYLSFL